ncbi:putative short-chain dehydrogenase [Aulographum hederae CBS 113979]|uniref:Putative short-chain dehydrogenase n=1 Tax=Aulographum hederae CBS 113979 TaxID=1176131 RepID=A0A6G1H5F3_9PEZI|nr:putative short-chain dehydrogenase [Aulographum hederae CBS 113979]
MDPSIWGAKTDASTVAEYYHNQIAGKTILITGVSPGSLAAEYVKALAPHGPKLLVLASRNISNFQAVIAPLKEKNPTVSFRPLVVDLASQKSIRKAADEVHSYEESIDVLVNNASLNGMKKYSVTEDEFETAFAVGHLGHFLFTGLIADKLSPKARIVVVSSMMHWMADVNMEDPNFDNGKTYDKDVAYARTKSANIHMIKALARRGFNAVVLHPGVAKTGMMREFTDAEAEKLVEEFNLEFQTNQQASATYVYGSFAPELSDTALNGAFLKDCKVDEAAPFCEVEGVGERLWKASERWVGLEWGSR